MKRQALLTLLITVLALTITGCAKHSPIAGGRGIRLTVSNLTNPSRNPRFIAGDQIELVAYGVPPGQQVEVCYWHEFSASVDGIRKQCGINPSGSDFSSPGSWRTSYVVSVEQHIGNWAAWIQANGQESNRVWYSVWPAQNVRGGHLPKVSVLPGQPALRSLHLLQANLDDDYFVEEISFGPADDASAQACVGNIRSIKLQYSNGAGQWMAADVHARHDCRVTFGFHADSRPFIGRDGKQGAAWEVVVETTRAYEGSQPGSFKIAILPKPFRAVMRNSGIVVDHLDDAPIVLNLTIVPQPRQ